MSTQPQKYTRNNPYISRMLVNVLVTGAGSEKETRHIELELEPGMEYTPGDAVGIVPENRPLEVAEVLEKLHFKGDERVLDHYKVEISLEEALRTRLAIGKLTRSAVNAYAKVAPESVPGYAALKTLTLPDNRSLAEEYIWGREFIDLITEYPGGITQPQQLFTILARLTPRMYSIASSQSWVKDAVHTIVRVVYYTSYQRDRQGLCSGHLGKRAPEGSTMPIFLHSNNNFRLPENTDTPVIMIGPGTGIAPFRAFLQHRKAHGHKGENWLFFGEQRRASDFLYREDLEGMFTDGILTRFDTAFSRDQAHKIYVQDRMREHAAELFNWLERGAHFYVCGDANRMAKDVETALLEAIAKGLNGTPEAAQEYLAAMKKAKRHQTDVY
ncbi:oxidoreductase [Alloacidobacterium dinghuense]|uniref:assimilatory sulfite reductase (NADPH) n=1 Tax=Alloacidobacterium dinghuense TaxID=2763107 RepID=A0A7G8BIU3_9BACT|nr:oxidoreductase [Alloacidobacterium dinghuense]QNI32463.1 oxidoreductase [Alloacidobacterium dinghuense]